MMCRPSLSLDTSVLNRFVKDRTSAPYVAAILSGFQVELPEMSVGEAYADPNPDRRQALFAVCRKLLTVGRCLHPAHWIIDLLVRRFHDDPASFDWKEVDITSSSIEYQIVTGGLLRDEDLVTRQRLEMRRLQKAFASWFKTPKLLVNAQTTLGCERPKTFSEWLDSAQRAGGHYWNTAQLIYEAAFETEISPQARSVTNVTPSEDSLKRFVEACPPFRSFLCALELTFYDRCIRPLEAVMKLNQRRHFAQVWLASTIGCGQTGS